MLRAVLFDLGETLLHFAPHDPREKLGEGLRMAYADLARTGACGVSARRYYWRSRLALEWAYLRSRLSLREFEATQVMVGVHRRLGLPVDSAALDRVARLLYEPMRRIGSVRDATRDVLHWLRGRRLQLAVVSNTFVPGWLLDEHLAEQGVAELFAARVYSCELGYRKPDRRMFEAALAALGRTADEAIFVGDLLKADVVGAQRAGMPAVWVAPNGRASPGRVRPDHVITDLTALPPIIEAYIAKAKESP